MKTPKLGTTRPAGYAALLERFRLNATQNWHISYVAGTAGHRIDSQGTTTNETYPSRYWPGDTACDHLEFALKYDGINLDILVSIFQAMDVQELTEYILSKPMGKYARRLWFLFELLTEQILPIEDLGSVSYIELLDSKRYFTISSPVRVRRQKICDNLLGDSHFCPTVRRTKSLSRFEELDLTQRCREVVAEFSKDQLRRALSYLYTKETKSSFEIEHAKPSASRVERFIELLQLAEHEDFCDKTHLIELQNKIVDQRFAADDYRSIQNYVGETINWQNERIHYVCPQPEDIERLMSGLVAAHQRMDSGQVSAVVHASCIAFGFVFLHPFEDGNGRIHRFLIHNILARRGFTPQGIMFPVSATMLNNADEYTAALEAFSKPLMTNLDYTLDEDGHMTVVGETAARYRYIDFTPQAEALAEFIERTVEQELRKELSFLLMYDRAKSSLQEIVDMPDRNIDLFIRFCLQNNGRLSSRKRKSHFQFLSDLEISEMEQALMHASEGSL